MEPRLYQRRGSRKSFDTEVAGGPGTQPATREANVRPWRELVLSRLLWVFVVLVSIAYLAGAGAALSARAWDILTFNTVCLSAIIGLALLPRRHYGSRAGGLLLVAFAVGIFFSARFGPLAAGPLWLLSVPVLAAIVHGKRAAAVALAAITVTLIVLTVLRMQQILTWGSGSELESWIALSGSLITLSAVLAFSAAFVLERLDAANLLLQREQAERAQTEEQLRQAQKMEAVGRLAGGVAHDFNNILTAIISFTTFAQQDTNDSAIAEDLDEVLKAAERAQNLTRYLLSFSRRRAVQPRLCDINELLDDLRNMLRPLLREDIELAVSKAAKLYQVEIDPTAFEQVLINLVVNARDAMPEGGRLTIETSTAQFSDGPRMAHGVEIAPGDYVVLSVSDTGIGMDSETVKHIFEPFFTTKSLQHGTGLGLATCYGIAAQAGGHITVYSEPGVGSVFKVYLPRAQRTPSLRPDTRPELESLSGSETILVAEDDEQVRSLVCRTLNASGYRVIETSSGEQALRCYQGTSSPVDLIISDVIMTGMTGKDLSDAVHKTQRTQVPTRFLFMSGYTADVMASRGIHEASSTLLNKPFSPSELLRAVRGALDATPPATEPSPN